MSGWRRLTAQGTEQVTRLPPAGPPVGAPIPWLVSTIPAGYLELNGQAITQAQYPLLFALYGGTLPDLRDKFLFGAGTTAAVGATGGEVNHTLSLGEIPSHGHAVQSGGGDTAWYDYAGGGVDTRVVLRPNTSGFAYGSNEWRATNNGGGGGHNNMPPYRAVRWITVAA